MSSTSGSPIRADFELTFRSSGPSPTTVEPIARYLSYSIVLLSANPWRSRSITLAYQITRSQLSSVISRKKNNKSTKKILARLQASAVWREHAQYNFSKSFVTLTTASASGIHVAVSTSRARMQVIRRTKRTMLVSPVVVDVAATLGRRIVPAWGPPLGLSLLRTISRIAITFLRWSHDPRRERSHRIYLFLLTSECGNVRLPAVYRAGEPRR